MIDQQECWVLTELDRQALRAKQAGQPRTQREPTTQDGGNR